MMLYFARKLFLLSAILITLLYYSPKIVEYLNKLEGPLAKGINFEVKESQSIVSISKILKQENVIHNRLLFILYVKIKGYEKKIRYGEYQVPENISADSLLNLFVSGKQVNHSLTILEGWTSWKVSEVLNSNELLSGKLIDIPLEGSLAPDTYFITKGENRNKTINRMKSRQEDILREAWSVRNIDLPLNSPRELLILASIIEKETSIKDERRIIASVLINRINKGMRLQVDPTVIYGITKGKRKLNRPLLKKDLKEKNEYNTYILSRLPKGPICNPGKDAIFAAAQPWKTKYLYFVADGQGGHRFAETLAEHKKNIQIWKKALDE